MPRKTTITYDDELTHPYIEPAVSYLVGRDAQGANRHGVFIQLNLLDDEHLSVVVDSLLNVTVFYQETKKGQFIYVYSTYTYKKHITQANTGSYRSH